MPTKDYRKKYTSLSKSDVIEIVSRKSLHRLLSLNGFDIPEEGQIFELRWTSFDEKWPLDQGHIFQEGKVSGVQSNVVIHTGRVLFTF